MTTVYVVDQFVRVGWDDCRRRKGVFSTDQAAREWIAAQESGDYDVTPVVVDALVVGLRHDPETPPTGVVGPPDFGAIDSFVREANREPDNQ
jgi:hypothetical protein